MSYIWTIKLYEKVKNEFQRRFEKSKKIKALRKKIENGESTYKDAGAFAIETGETLSDVFLNHMLYLKYPKAFREDTEKLTLKEEYRGISDILNGVSGGEMNLGYWHDNEYWKKPGRVEAESFAQLGRTLYNGNKKVLDMFQDIFPDSYKEAMGTIERMIK